MRRLTLTGEDLRAGTADGIARPAFDSRGFDDHVKLVIPTLSGEPQHIGIQREYTFEWNREVLATTRDYSVRTWDAAAGELTIDVVRHHGGFASTWAYRAEIGDALHLAGPKTSAGLSPEIDFHLLIGDETALPAIGRWLEEAADGTRARIIVEVPTDADIQHIDTAAEAEITWLVRNEIPAGHSPLLLDAVRRLELPPVRTFAWCAGEAMTLVPIRRFLRTELGLPREDVEVVGYWRRPLTERTEAPAAPVAARTVPTSAEPASSAGSEAESRSVLAPVPSHPEPAATEALPAAAGTRSERAAAVAAVHEMTELAAPIVTRVAVTLGIGVHIAAGIDTRACLAEETGIPAQRLDVLIDAMVSLGLLREDGELLRNTALGGVLLDDEAGAELSLDNPVNREALALVDLLEVLRSGVPTSSRAQTRMQSASVDAAYDAAAGELLSFGLDPLTDFDQLRGAGSVVAFGDGLEELARGLMRRAPSVAVGLMVEPHRHDALAAAVADVPVTVHRTGGDWQPGDCAILVSALAGRSDAEAQSILGAARSAARSLVILEPIGDGAAEDDHIAEDALIELAVTGQGLRTSAEICELAARAGWRGASSQQLGWGFATYRTAVIADE